jgi:hypothetical protein
MKSTELLAITLNMYNIDRLQSREKRTPTYIMKSVLGKLSHPSILTWTLQHIDIIVVNAGSYTKGYLISEYYKVFSRGGITLWRVQN